jgi:hypothetical protein
MICAQQAVFRLNVVSSVSPSRMLPLVTVSSPAAQYMSVDLPEQDGPMMAVNRPRSNRAFTASRARTSVSFEP